MPAGAHAERRTPGLRVFAGFTNRRKRYWNKKEGEGGAADDGGASEMEDIDAIGDQGEN